MTNSKKGNRPGIRRVGRTLAFQVLYSGFFVDKENPDDLNTRFMRYPLAEEQDSETALEFAMDLVKGVEENLKVIDAAIEAHSQNWKIERIAMVELAILRLSLYEMMFTDIPVKAAINEAIELSKTFGDDKSRSFVNGILDGSAKTLDK